MSEPETIAATKRALAMSGSERHFDSNTLPRVMGDIVYVGDNPLRRDRTAVYRNLNGSYRIVEYGTQDQRDRDIQRRSSK